MFFDFLKEYEGMKPGLSRIKKFLNAAGNPQNTFRCVHIAGTNGKGSTAVLTANVLKESGYKTALYTSPHLVKITERIKVNGKNIPDKVFNVLVKKYLSLADKCKLSYFEYLTAIAFLYFASKKVDIAVIETGLGGRFDATNVIKSPLICVITSIALDHEEILGGSLKKIAFEKAGIIKKGAALICGKLPKDAISVINKKSDFSMYGRDFGADNIKRYKSSFAQSFDYYGASKRIKNIKLALAGKYQLQNAAVAAACIECLNEKEGYILNDTALRKGFAGVKWPARFDIRKICFENKRFELIIDGAHNRQGIDGFLDALENFDNKKRCFIFAMMKGKNYKNAVKKIALYSHKVIIVKLKNERAVATEILVKEFGKYIPADKILTANSATAALRMLKNGSKVAAAGSLYLAGEIIKILGNGDN
jgi:folylpolyglutamate synthase/dihydrofolate synthase